MYVRVFCKCKPQNAFNGLYLGFLRFKVGVVLRLMHTLGECLIALGMCQSVLKVRILRLKNNEKKPLIRKKKRPMYTDTYGFPLLGDDPIVHW